MYCKFVCFLQVIVSVVWTAVEVPTVKQVMPSYSEKYVELTCSTYVGASIFYITYNMVCCFVIRVLITRILPHRLYRQDVKRMRMLVDALLVLWICYIPLYMMTTIHWHLLMIQNMLLMFNIYLVIGFILIPKVHKLYKNTG